MRVKWTLGVGEVGASDPSTTTVLLLLLRPRRAPLKDAPEPGSCLKATRSNWSPPAYPRHSTTRGVRWVRAVAVEVQGARVACTNWKDKSPEKVVPDMVVSPSKWHESSMASVKDASRKDAPIQSRAISRDLA